MSTKKQYVSSVARPKNATRDAFLLFIQKQQRVIFLSTEREKLTQKQCHG